MNLEALLRAARGLALAAGVSASRRVTASTEPLGVFDVLVTHPLLTNATRQLFVDGHYARAVEQGFKAVNSLVKQRTGFADEGRPLMERAFSPNGPKLVVNSLKTRTEKDEQTGTMFLFAGAMAGIRNVRTHDLSHVDDAPTPLELLGFANYLMHIAQMAAIAKLVRRAESTCTKVNPGTV